MLRYKGVNANAQSAASHQQRQNNGGHLDPFLLHILSTSFLLRHPGGAFVYELLPHFLGNGFVCGYGGHIGFDLRLRAGGAHSLQPFSALYSSTLDLGRSMGADLPLTRSVDRELW